MKDNCSIADCDRPASRRGWCSPHYARWKRHGDPLGGGPNRGAYRKRPVLDRFWSKVTKTDDCWLWQAGCQSEGYGVFEVEGRVMLAHQFVFESEGGQVQSGKMLDHTCRTRTCVNPAHLHEVTAKQNNENLGDTRANSTTGIRGVSYIRARGRYRAAVSHNGKSHHAGYFQAADDAEAAAVAARLRLHTNNLADRRQTIG